MRHCFFDTSAFAKLYAVEPGMKPVRDLLRIANARPDWTRLLVCDLTLPETFSAVTNMQACPDAARKGLSASALKEILPRIRLQFGAGSPSWWYLPPTAWNSRLTSLRSIGCVGQTVYNWRLPCGPGLSPRIPIRFSSSARTSRSAARRSGKGWRCFGRPRSLIDVCPKD